MRRDTPRAHRDEFDYATEQLDRVKEIIPAYIAGSPFEIESTQRRGPHGATRHSVRVKVRQSPPARLHSVIGSCLNSLRSSLDYLATELCEAKGPPKRPDKIEFPIYHSEKAFVESAPRKIGEAGPDAFAAVHALQPFHESDPTRHPLWLANDLCRVHKHRTHLATTAIAGLGELKVYQGALVRMHAHQVRLGAFESGDEVFSVIAFPHPPLQFDLRLAFDIAFGKGLSAEGAPVVSLLTGLHDHIRDVVFERLECFLGASTPQTKD